MRVGIAVGQALALAAAALALAHAQGTDPLHSPECDAARAVLERALDEAARKDPGSAARLTAARKQAMEACLGRESGERERSGAPEPAIAVPPAVMQPPHARAAPAVVVPQPPAYVAPAVVTTCDNTGCWDSNGQRINRLGPMLVGPRGVCTVVGGTVHCP
ncbi:MAG TPA: hypothetical protein VIE63_00025 [Ramlibacter sp.]